REPHRVSRAGRSVPAKGALAPSHRGELLGAERLGEGLRHPVKHSHSLPFGQRRAAPTPRLRSRRTSSTTRSGRGFKRSLRVTIPRTVVGSSGATTGSRPTSFWAIRSAAIRQGSQV